MKTLKELHPAWIAGAIGVLAALWLASGLGKNAELDTAVEPSPDTRPVTVRVVNSRASERLRESTVSGRTAAIRTVPLRAETSGQVIEVLAERGQTVSQGQLLVRLAVKDRQAQLHKAEALLKQRKLQYQAAQRLHRRGHQSDVELAQAAANLATAQADVRNRADDLAATEIRAPFAGLLEARQAELGHFVNAGDELGRVMQRQPFLVRGQVTEDEIRFLTAGQPGRAVINGKTYAGQLRFVAQQADSRTRTFEVELEIQNSDMDLVAGVSAVMLLPLDTVRVHQLDTVMLTLDEAGDFGIKTVDADGIVQFRQADIAQSRADSVWLSGLPDELQVISVGQGFVSAGQRVTATVVSR